MALIPVRFWPVLPLLGAAGLPSWAWAAAEPEPESKPLVLVSATEEEPVPLFQPAPAAASYMDFGGVGHLQTPSARMAADGEFAFTFNEGDPYRLLSITNQVLPRLEVVARYVLVKTVQLDAGENYVDKGIDLKFLLRQESEHLPAVAVGMRDIAGTGLFSSEYLVASKRLNNWDLSVGLGWGNLASQSNGISSPLCSLADRFCQRASGFSGTGGDISFQRFFAGPISPFVGVTWQTPHAPLRLIAEVEGNDYQNELIGGALQQDLPVNVAGVYRLHPNIDFKLAFERGNTASFGVTLHTNFNSLSQVKLLPPKASITEPLPAQADWPALGQKLKTQAGFKLSAIEQQGSAVRVRGQQTEYRDVPTANERTLRVLQANLPPEVTELEVLETVANQPLVATRVQRQLLLDAFTPSDQQPTLAEVITVQEPAAPGTLVHESAESPWLVNLVPFLQQGFGGTDSFYFYELGAKASVEYRQAQNLFEANVLAGLLNNYDFKTDNAPTTLPQVRIRIREYLDNQPIRLESVQASRFFHPAQSVYAQATGGFLELMFAGVGGELLYRPLGATWGLGADLNVVRQRSPESAFAIESYQVTTGHLTYYQQFPAFHNVQLKLSAGQYLAGDRGITVDFSRQFDSGVVIGAFATKTNISAEEFGEGSFDKGFYLSIPIDLMTVRHTKARANISFVPIQRDGGAKLYRRNQLWDLTAPRGGNTGASNVTLGGY